MCLKQGFVCLLNKTIRRDGLATGYTRRNAVALVILILMGAGLTSSFIVKANPSLADAPAPEAETGGAISFSGLPSDPEGSQTSSFLTILSAPPYIVGQPLRLKGGVLPGRNGTMSFYDGTTLLGAAPLRLELNGSMQAELLAPGLAEGLHILTAVYDGDGAVSPSRPVYVVRQATSVSSANYRGETLAPDQITATFGVRLANSQQTAASLPLPTTLDGTTVSVSDSAGMTRAAPLFYVSPGQVNHLIPAGTAAGPATITITAGDGSVSGASAQITAIAPGVFTADATGRGLAAAQVLRVKPDGSFRYEPVTEYDQLSGRYSAVLIDLGAESDQVFLILYGTGFRHRGSLSAATATVGGGDANVLYAGAQGVLAGLDQANLRLPRSLIGRGEVDVVLTVDGKAANTVKVSVK